MFRFAGFLLFLLFPFQAVALSCLPWSMEQAFQKASRSDENYFIVHGELRFDASKLPRFDLARQANKPPLTRIKARFEGRGMTSNGFAAPFDETVELVVHCIGPWCGRVKSGERYLAFLRRDETGYVVVADPCSGMLFGNPEPLTLQRAVGCFAGAECKPRLP